MAGIFPLKKDDVNRHCKDLPRMGSIAALTHHLVVIAILHGALTFFGRVAIQAILLLQSCC